MGEASGEHEQRDQLPFRPYAPAGSVLERIDRRMGMSRQQFATTNVLRCRPLRNWLEGAPWEIPAIRRCRPNLAATIATYRPRAIEALGGTAMRELTSMTGEAQGISHLAGYVIPLMYDLDPGQQAQPPVPPLPVIGNFHPSFLRRGKASYQGVFSRFQHRAINIAAGRDRAWLWHVDPADATTWGNKRYNVTPSLDDARAFLNRVRDNANVPVAEDIETPESASMDEDAREGFQSTQVRQIQFSMGPHEGIAFPWEEPYRSIASAILHTPNPKYGHNWDLFDHKVLRAAALRESWTYAPTVRPFDTMDMFHHWQPDLPAHLQFACSFIQFPFPWKHLHTVEHEPFYGCVDVDSDWQLGEFVMAMLKRDGLWGDHQTGYIGQLYEVRPILAGMEDRGMPIDDAARLALGAEFERAQDELGRELSKLAEGCGLVDQFVGLNPELREWFINHGTQPKLWHEHPADGIQELLATTFTDQDGKLYRYERRKFPVADVDATTGEPVMRETTRWCRVYDFNPNSRNQILAYMDARGHKRPKARELDEDGESKDSTAAKELERLAASTGDSFYLKCRDYKGLTKMRGTYVDGFKPMADGCVHTSFTFQTGIGQLSSRNPNCQNFPKLKPTVALATAMRRMVRAKPGNVLTEWDFKSCHIITLGFLAEDTNYIRLGRLDMHSFVAGHFLKLWNGFDAFKWSDDELLAKFKWLKSDPDRKRVRDDQAKHGILGIGNGLRAKGLFERYMDCFPPRPCSACNGTGRIPGARPSLTRQCPACKHTGIESGRRVAEEVLEVAEALFAKVFEHQERERADAHDKRELRTKFGHIRRFYEVFRWDPRKRNKVTGRLGDWGHGDQAEEAVAFRLANIAFGHIREKLKQLAAADMDSRYGLFNNIHDSFLFHFPADQLEQHVADVYPILTSPSQVLRHHTIAPDGLVIDVEGAVGECWADMSKIDLHKPVEVSVS